MLQIIISLLLLGLHAFIIQRGKAHPYCQWKYGCSQCSHSFLPPTLFQKKKMHSEVASYLCNCLSRQ